MSFNAEREFDESETPDEDGGYKISATDCCLCEQINSFDKSTWNGTDDHHTNLCRRRITCIANLKSDVPHLCEQIICHNAKES